MLQFAFVFFFLVLLISPLMMNPWQNFTFDASVPISLYSFFMEQIQRLHHLCICSHYENYILIQNWRIHVHFYYLEDYVSHQDVYLTCKVFYNKTGRQLLSMFTCQEFYGRVRFILLYHNSYCYLQFTAEEPLNELKDLTKIATNCPPHTNRINI